MNQDPKLPPMPDETNLRLRLIEVALRAAKDASSSKERDIVISLVRKMLRTYALAAIELNRATLAQEGEAQTSWATDGGYRCLNCGNGLLQHEGQRTCPPAQSAPQAPQAAPTVPTNATGEKDYEHRHAVMQGECIAACDEYFEARPQIDNGDRRRIFEAGFERGYKQGAAMLVAAPSAPVEAKPAGGSDD